MTVPADATAIVKSVSSSDPDAVAQLLPLVYAELRQLAAKYLARERNDHSLQATALVHEAYVRLVDQTQASWQDHAHFCGVASRVMRQILVDHARRRGRLKRQGQRKRLSLDEGRLITGQANVDLEQLDEALTQLASLDERSAKVVELRFFGGMQMREISEVLKVSERTVAADWSYAKAWLHNELGQ